jgi:hypothetical protein
VAAQLLELDAAKVATLSDPQKAAAQLLKAPLEAWVDAAGAGEERQASTSAAPLLCGSGRVGDCSPCAASGPLPRPKRRVSIPSLLPSLQLVILLDALDEGDPLEEQLGAAEGQKQTGVRACANRVFRLLATELQALPPCVRFLVTTRPDAVGGSVLSALDIVFRDAGGVAHMQLGQLYSAARLAAVASADGGEKPCGEVLVLRAVVVGCPEAAPRAGTAESEPAGGLEQLYAAYGRVFDAVSASKAQPAAAAPAAQPVGLLPAGVKRLVDVLLAAQEPLPLSLLASLGLDEALLPQLPGWGCLFFTQEHRVYLLRESCAAAERPLWQWHAQGWYRHIATRGLRGAKRLPLSPVPPQPSVRRPCPADKSLADWLMDSGASQRHAADLQAGHRFLTQQLLQLVVRAQGGSGNGLAAAYVQQYLAQHAVACGDVPALEELVTSFGFLADVFRVGHGSKLVGDLASAALDGASFTSSELLRDAQRWLLAEQAALTGLGPKATSKAVVQSALKACPQGGPLQAAARREIYVRAALAAGQQPWDCRLVLGRVARAWGQLVSTLKVGF